MKPLMKKAILAVLISVFTINTIFCNLANIWLSPLKKKGKPSIFTRLQITKQKIKGSMNHIKFKA
jgi:hypothetical protein